MLSQLTKITVWALQISLSLTSTLNLAMKEPHVVREIVDTSKTVGEPWYGLTDQFYGRNARRNKTLETGRTDRKVSANFVQTVRVDSRARPAVAGPARRLAVDGFVFAWGFPDAQRIEHAPATRPPLVSQ